MKKTVSVLLLSLILYGCGVQNLPAVPTPAQPLRVILTPSTELWSGALNHCTQQNADLLVFVAIDAQPGDLTDSDSFIIRSGESSSMMNQYLLAESELVMIVHPDNPIRSLSTEQIQMIFTGFAGTWGVVDASLPAEFQSVKITPVHYGVKDDIEMTFQGQFIEPIVMSFSSISLSSPSEVVSAVSEQSGGIGFIPKNWLVSSVRTVELEHKIAYPLIMLTKGEPEGRLKQLMICLQEQASELN